MRGEQDEGDGGHRSEEGVEVDPERRRLDRERLLDHGSEPEREQDEDDERHVVATAVVRWWLRVYEGYAGLLDPPE